MKRELIFRNAFWLMVPLLLWNIILAPYINIEKVVSDANSPQWLLLSENITRIMAFAIPLLFQMKFGSESRLGWAVYIIGTLVYFGSWLPLMLAPQSAWSTSAVGLLAPRITPFFSFLGIAMVCGISIQTGLYAAIALVFILLHTLHGVQNL